MPRYHFNFADDLSLDDEGFELKDLAVAKCEALKMAGHIISDEAAAFWDRAEWSMTVTDPTGLALFRLEIVGTESPAVHSLAQPAIGSSLRGG
jgi:hypothetical protein